MRKYRIIIVENDEDEQFFMRKGFDAIGLFEVVAQLRNGDALLDWLKHHSATETDIILSDLNMPGKNGYDIIQFIRTNPLWAHLPIIIASTSSTRTIIEKCLSSGASDYMVKPETFIKYKAFARDLYHRVEEKQFVA